MERNKNALIQIESFSNVLDTASLFLVYRTLCGSSAIGLYGLLSHMPVQDPLTHALLAQLLGVSHETLVSDFEALEQVSLIESYHHPLADAYIYTIKAPLRIQEALNHPVLGRAFLQAAGESRYVAIKKRYIPTKPVNLGYDDISTPFDGQRLHTFDPKVETHFEAPQQELSGLRFNLLSFKQRCSELVFPQALRTAENLKLIEELGSVYGISVPKMIQLLGECVNIAAMTFDGEKLESLMRKVKEPVEMPEDPYQAEPVQFLRALQGGKEPTDTEKRLITSLVREQRLNPEVVNVLIQHALESSNQTLKKSYVETIAASWGRLKISTKDQALAHIAGLSKKADKGRKEPIPDYSNEKGTMSESEIEALKARIKKIGGANGKD